MFYVTTLIILAVFLPIELKVKGTLNVSPLRNVFSKPCSRLEGFCGLELPETGKLIYCSDMIPNI